MTMIGNDFPVRANALCLNSEKRASSAPTSPAGIPCFDIFSPPPGDRDVISQVERLSSMETNIAPRSLRIAFGASGRSATGLHGRLQSGWSQPHSARAPVAIYSHGILIGSGVANVRRKLPRL